MPKNIVIFIYLLMNITAFHSAPPRILIQDHSPQDLVITKIDITGKSSELWQPSTVRLWVSSSQSFSIHAENGNEAMAIREQILRVGRVQCKINIGQTCGEYRIPKE